MQQLNAAALRVHFVPTVDLASSQREIGAWHRARRAQLGKTGTGAGQSPCSARRLRQGEAVRTGKAAGGEKFALCSGE
jgi:hypothetical protein